MVNNIVLYNKKILLKPELHVDREEKDDEFLSMSATEEHKTKPNTGVVVKVAEDVEVDIKEGYKVLFRRGAGTQFMNEGIEYLILDFHEVILKLA